MTDKAFWNMEMQNIKERMTMPSPEKFRETLTEFAVRQSVIDEIYLGYDGLISKTNKKIKSAFFKHALDVMNEKLPKEQTQKILEANACCKSGARIKASKEFAKENGGLSLEEKLELITSKPELYMGQAHLDENGDIIVTGAGVYADGKYECVCPTVSKVKLDYAIPREYCYCCGGHFKFHYEIMLNVKLELMEIVSSPHDTEGRKPCVFRFRVLPTLG